MGITPTAILLFAHPFFHLFHERNQFLALFFRQDRMEFREFIDHEAVHIGPEFLSFIEKPFEAFPVDGIPGNLLTESREHFGPLFPAFREFGDDVGLDGVELLFLFVGKIELLRYFLRHEIDTVLDTRRTEETGKMVTATGE